MTDKPTTKPLLATVGVGDLLYDAVLDAVSRVRERSTSADVSSRVDEARERLTHLRTRLSQLPTELPEEWAGLRERLRSRELRERLSAEEVKRVADQYVQQALALYAELAERGEGRVEQLRANETYQDVSERAEEVIGKVSDLWKNSGKSADNPESAAASRPSDESSEKESEPPAETSEPSGQSEPVVREPESSAAAPEPAPKKPARKRAPAKKTTTKKTTPRKNPPKTS